MIERALGSLGPESHERVVRIARLPDLVRGYEDVKLRNVQRFREEARALGAEA
jgi:indolepyruvate ferredoxin oxidoreductase